MCDGDRLGEPFGFGGPVASIRFERSDEFAHLITFALVLPDEDRADDVAADIEKHAPEQGMAPEIHAGQAEEFGRFEQRDAERPVREQVGRRSIPSG